MTFFQNRVSVLEIVFSPGKTQGQESQGIERACFSQDCLQFSVKGSALRKERFPKTNCAVSLCFSRESNPIFERHLLCYLQLLHNQEWNLAKQL